MSPGAVVYQVAARQAVVVVRHMRTFVLPLLLWANMPNKLYNVYAFIVHLFPLHFSSTKGKKS